MVADVYTMINLTRYILTTISWFKFEFTRDPFGSNVVVIDMLIGLVIQVDTQWLRLCSEPCLCERTKKRKACCTYPTLTVIISPLWYFKSDKEYISCLRHEIWSLGSDMYGPPFILSCC